MEEQAVSIWAGTSGQARRRPGRRRTPVRVGSSWTTSSGTTRASLDTIRETRNWSDDTASSLESAYDSFLDQFETGDGQSLRAGKEEFEALEDSDVEQEQIVKQKRG